jgi:centromeric protein E
MRPGQDDEAEAAIWSCGRSAHPILPTELHPALAKRTIWSERAGASVADEVEG